MFSFRILNGLDSISVACDEESALRSRTGEASRQKVLLRAADKFRCGLSVIISFALIFSTSTLIFSTPVFAAANGAKPVDEFAYAKDVLNYISSHLICSSVNIKNATNLAACTSDVNALTSLVNEFDSKLKAGTLTIAMDITLENELGSDLTALQEVLKAAGFTAAPSVASRSPALQIVSDDISPDTASPAQCAALNAGAAAGEIACLGAEVPISALLCIISIALTYIGSVPQECTPPLTPPVLCP
jgi:hypothetical protein